MEFDWVRILIKSNFIKVQLGIIILLFMAIVLVNVGIRVVNHTGEGIKSKILDFHKVLTVNYSF